MSGNEAAHGVHTTVDSSDARNILDFTRALMEYVYTFNRQFERFKKRRAAEKT